MAAGKKKSHVVKKLSGKEKMNKKVGRVQNITDCLGSYKSMHIFKVNSMRNNIYKRFIEENKDDVKIFFSKNSNTILALKDEFKDGKNLEKFKELMVGQVGILFSNLDEKDLNEKLKNYCEPEFAVTGCVSEVDIKLNKGQVESFTPSMESHLRKLLLPITIKNGKVFLDSDFVVCEANDVLNSTQCAILKLLNEKISQFEIVLLHSYKIVNRKLV